MRKRLPFVAKSSPYTSELGKPCDFPLFDRTPTIPTRWHRMQPPDQPLA